jgi:DNA-binding NtrC family response regulator
VRAALNLFEANAGGYDLLLSDVVLPDHDGLYLADMCREAEPGLPVLLASGLTDQRTYLLDIRARGYRFLPKPFGLMDLLPAVKEALEG